MNSVKYVNLQKDNLYLYYILIQEDSNFLYLLDIFDSEKSIKINKQDYAYSFFELNDDLFFKDFLKTLVNDKRFDKDQKRNILFTINPHLSFKIALGISDLGIRNCIEVKDINHNELKESLLNKLKLSYETIIENIESDEDLTQKQRENLIELANLENDSFIEVIKKEKLITIIDKWPAFLTVNMPYNTILRQELQKLENIENSKDNILG